jgi:hypothetical protein
VGETAAETVTEIERTRARLDAELRDLEGRLPVMGVWIKRGVGALVGGGLGAAAIKFLIRRRHKHERDKRIRTLERRIQRIERELVL